MTGTSGWREFIGNSAWAEIDPTGTAQGRGEPQPPFQVAPTEATPDIQLPEPPAGFGLRPFREVLAARRSRRKFTEEPVTLEELSFLLWATQGLQKVIRGGVATLRTVPSGGARHPFETILVLRSVTGVAPARYRYAPSRHGLLRTGDIPSTGEVSAACVGQDFVACAPVVFFWTAVPSRTEWRYGPASGKLIAIDAGHLCQNLYLACEALGLGTCAIGAYDQELSDRVAGVDGDSELVVYAAPVGRPS
jgi:SagB-type dehydrogenase family enzyme